METPRSHDRSSSNLSKMEELERAGVDNEDAGRLATLLHIAETDKLSESEQAEIERLRAKYAAALAS